jgi:hypothetical protein
LKIYTWLHLLHSWVLTQILHCISTSWIIQQVEIQYKHPSVACDYLGNWNCNFICISFSNVTATCKTIVQVNIFWVVTPCSVAAGYKPFRGPYCHHLQGEVKTSNLSCRTIGLYLMLTW